MHARRADGDALDRDGAGQAVALAREPSLTPARRSPAVPMIENHDQAGGFGVSAFAASASSARSGEGDRCLTTRTGVDSLTMGVSDDTAGPAVSSRASASSALSSPSNVTIPVTISWRSRQSASVSRSIASADTASPVSAAPASSADSSARGQPKTTRSSGSPETPAAGSTVTAASVPCEAVAAARSLRLRSNRLRAGDASAPAFSMTTGYPSPAPSARPVSRPALSAASATV